MGELEINYGVEWILNIEIMACVACVPSLTIGRGVNCRRRMFGKVYFLILLLDGNAGFIEKCDKMNNTALGAIKMYSLGKNQFSNVVTVLLESGYVLHWN